jgi:hypothetical protein
MDFEIDEGTFEGQAVPREKTDYRLEGIIGAKDLSREEFEELAELKKQGKTTTEENFAVDKHFWKRYLVTRELDPKILKEFMYDNKPLENFLSLVDIRNHRREDNVKSAKHVERTELARKLVEGLGFASVADKAKISKEVLVQSFEANVVESQEFQKRKRINELFDLNKNRSIEKDMTPQRILLWTNSILKSYGVNIKAENGRYRLEDKLGLMALVKRKNGIGRYFVDGRDLLGQTRGDDDLFVDEETGEVRSKSKKEIDTSFLDRGIRD